MNSFIKIFQLVLILFIAGNSDANAQSVENHDRKQLFDDHWKFFLGDKPQANAINFDDKAWRDVNLPHDWSIEGEFDSSHPTGNDGGYLPAGVGWYRKTFTLPVDWKDKHISIYFEGVYMNSEVFINGKSLGVYPYGYTSFSYDLTPYLDSGKENVLSVRVDNSKQKNSRWYSGSGIYRHVWLIVTDNIHVAQWGVGITTPRVTSQAATVQINTRVKNQTNSPQSIRLRTTLSGPDNRKTESDFISVELAANSAKEIKQIINVSNPKLWSPDFPHLYQALTQIVKDDEPIDEVTTTFGIRSLKFTTENGFQLNGKTIKLNGGCVHHDNGCLGAAAYDRAEERKVELLKSAGFNAIRTAHNPPSEAFLDACDRLGIMVIDEVFDGWRTQKIPYDYAMYFDDWWQRDTEAMIKRDRNHPSVIMWSIGNEIIERKEPQAVETAKNLSNYVKQIDSTRPVTSGMTAWDEDWEIFDPLMAAHDVAGYNYQLHRAPSDHERVPSRIIVQTESFPRDAFANWKLVQENNYIIGDFVWTAMDYLGESGIGRWYYSGDIPGEHWERDMFPWHGAYCGDIDLTGWRKPISHYRSMLYNSTEKLYMAVREPETETREIKETLWSVWPTWESWTWPGYEGKDIQVEVYSRYPEVRLYLNNQLVEEKPTTVEEQFKATFTIPYSPGEIRAVGMLDGKQMESVVLSTAGDASKIKLTPDRTTIQSNGQDLSYVSVEITDVKGRLLPHAENRLQFKIEGPGEIIGVDNANIKDSDPYTGNTRKAWHGRALVVVKSTRKDGSIRLTVNSPGLPDATVTINTQSDQ